MREAPATPTEHKPETALLLLSRIESDTGTIVLFAIAGQAPRCDKIAMAKPKKETPKQYLVINPKGYRLVAGKRPTTDGNTPARFGTGHRTFMLGREGENKESGLPLNKLANDFLKIGGWLAAEVYGNAMIFADARSMEWVIGLIEQAGGKDLASGKKSAASE